MVRVKTLLNNRVFTVERQPKAEVASASLAATADGGSVRLR